MALGRQVLQDSRPGGARLRAWPDPIQRAARQTRARGPNRRHAAGDERRRRLPRGSPDAQRGARACLGGTNALSRNGREPRVAAEGCRGAQSDAPVRAYPDRQTIQARSEKNHPVPEQGLKAAVPKSLYSWGVSFTV